MSNTELRTEETMETMWENYRENIIRMINGIQNKGTLEYLNCFIELFLEKWGW